MEEASERGEIEERERLQLETKVKPVVGLGYSHAVTYTLREETAARKNGFSDEFMMWPSSSFPQTLAMMTSLLTNTSQVSSSPWPLQGSATLVLRRLLHAAGPSSTCFLQTLQSRTKGPASLVHRVSFLLPLPRPLPHTLSGVLISRLQREEHAVLKWETKREIA